VSGLTADWAGALASAIDAKVMRAVGDWSATEMGALLTCLSFGEVGIGDLGEVLGLTGSGAVRLVDRLEQDELVARQARQGRSVSVRLSARGRRLAVDLRRRRLGAIEDLLASLSADERVLIANLLAKMLHSAELDAPRARMVCRFCDHRRCEGDTCPIGRSLRERGMPTFSARSG
jgi:MarR family transcriptional regulator, negative regulator of the multidrug operon emrRAB